MVERVNMTMPDDMRDRFEAWRAEQYKQTGRIPSQADAARILVHKGLCADGFETSVFEPSKQAWGYIPDETDRSVSATEECDHTRLTKICPVCGPSVNEQSEQVRDFDDTQSAYAVIEEAFFPQDPDVAPTETSVNATPDQERKCSYPPNPRNHRASNP